MLRKDVLDLEAPAGVAAQPHSTFGLAVGPPVDVLGQFRQNVPETVLLHGPVVEVLERVVEPGGQLRLGGDEATGDEGYEIVLAGDPAHLLRPAGEVPFESARRFAGDT